MIAAAIQCIINIVPKNGPKQTPEWYFPFEFAVHFIIFLLFLILEFPIIGAEYSWPDSNLSLNSTISLPIDASFQCNLIEIAQLNILCAQHSVIHYWIAKGIIARHKIAHHRPIWFVWRDRCNVVIFKTEKLHVHTGYLPSVILWIWVFSPSRIWSGAGFKQNRRHFCQYRWTAFVEICSTIKSKWTRRMSHSRDKKRVQLRSNPFCIVLGKGTL